MKQLFFLVVVLITRQASGSRSHQAMPKKIITIKPKNYFRIFERSNMKRTKKIAGVVTALAILPFMAFAQGPSVSTRINLSSWTGTVSSISGNTFTLAANNGATYTVDASAAKTHRRFGAIMQVVDIQAGDSVVIKGTAEGSNIKALVIRDTSLQAKNGVFSGKVVAVNGSSFTVQSGARGSQTVNTDSITVFKKNGQAAQLSDIVVGSQVRVTGVWDKTNNNIFAKFVNVVVRMARVNIGGSLSSVSGNSLTVSASNGTTYTVDASNAHIVKKFGGKINLSDLNSGDTLKVNGRHEVGSTSVMAGLVRDTSITK